MLTIYMAQCHIDILNTHALSIICECKNNCHHV